MQAIEHRSKKSVTISADVHRRIAALREGNETYGDVVAASVRALEEKKQISAIPCIDDISDEELDRRLLEMKEHPELCSTLDECLRDYHETRRKK
jgi:predicted CopG family antitoxin